jgi:hypothetical protein
LENFKEEMLQSINSSDAEEPFVTDQKQGASVPTAPLLPQPALLPPLLDRQSFRDFVAKRQRMQLLRLWDSLVDSNDLLAQVNTLAHIGSARNNAFICNHIAFALSSSNGYHSLFQRVDAPRLNALLELFLGWRFGKRLGQLELDAFELIYKYFVEEEEASLSALTMDRHLNAICMTLKSTKLMRSKFPDTERIVIGLMRDNWQHLPPLFLSEFLNNISSNFGFFMLHFPAQVSFFNFS